MGTEISLFSKKSFIEASKKFVCVRLGSYESKEHQEMVRKLLRGTFQNTAFVVFTPDGKEPLTRSGRSPKHAFGRDVEAGMKEISDKYPVKGASEGSVLADFHSFKQSLNVASADQRLLVFCVKGKATPVKADVKVRNIFNDKEMKGRFFFDTMGKEDQGWMKNVKGAKDEEGIFIIRSGKYGTDGTVMKYLPWTASFDELKSALKVANVEFAKTEKRKVYSEHVADGVKEGIDYKNTMPPGEDRDGDGKIDPKRRRR